MVACYRDERGVARMVQGVDFIQLGSKVGPGLAQIASQFEARLAGACQQGAADMVQGGRYSRKVIPVDRVARATVGWSAMMQALHRGM